MDSYDAISGAVSRGAMVPATASARHGLDHERFRPAVGMDTKPRPASAAGADVSPDLARHPAQPGFNTDWRGSRLIGTRGGSRELAMFLNGLRAATENHSDRAALPE